MTQSDPDFSNVQSGSSTTAPAAESSTLYVVKPGDTLSKIAKAYYQDGNKWKVIYEANSTLLTDPDIIQPGQKLHIPTL